MKSYIQIATLLAAAWATAAVEQRCEVEGGKMDCTERGLFDVPPGYRPGIETLFLGYNSISTLYADSFSGFPNVRALRIHKNPLTVLELEVLADMPFLEHVYLYGCQIHTVQPAPPGVTFNYLEEFSLIENPITSLDPDILLSAPNLRSLNLGVTGFIVPSSGPILNHPKVEWINIQVSDARGLHPDSLSKLPNLNDILFLSSGVTNVTGVFANARLIHIDLAGNPVKEVTAGAFLAAEAMTYMEFQNSDLERLDVSAVNGVVPSGGTIIITNTPLACSCGYESLYWWAVAKGVTLHAECSGVVCSFLRRGP